jgi:hypothetical protein
MKRLSIFFLAFVTIWMSTWMVTDIHGWAEQENNQPHPVFSFNQTVSDDDHLATVTDHQPHCGVCSYDHGGHIGHTLAAISYFAPVIQSQNQIDILHPDFWYSRTTIPTLRPPIV